MNTEFDEWADSYEDLYKKKDQNVVEKLVGYVEWKNILRSVEGQVVRFGMDQDLRLVEARNLLR